MNNAELESAIELCRDANVTTFIHGAHGFGKSTTVRMLCQKRGWGFVDFRASQIESSDLRGLPDKLDGKTVYYPPEDLPHGEFKCLKCVEINGPMAHVNGSTFGMNGIFAVTKEMPTTCPKGHSGDNVIVMNDGLLFLDELNRADDDVLQASFQLVLDRRIGRYVLPTGWHVVAAGNPQKGYMVNAFNDPAFLDRFCHLQLTRSKEYVQGWVEYMTKAPMINKNVVDKIVQFACFDENNLAAKMDSDLGFSITPSPRSWEAVARVMSAAMNKNFNRDVVRGVVAGLVGQDIANSYDNFSIDVTPSDILDNGVKAVESKLKALGRGQLIGLVWAVSSHAKERFKDKDKTKVTEMMSNTLDFIAYLSACKERDVAVMLGTSLVETETASLGAAVLSNPELAKMTAKFKKNSGPSWITAINERPDLQKLLAKVTYGV